jgi:chemotaxis protein MotB
MRKSLVAMTVFALVPFVLAGCVSKSEYMKTVDAANALEVDNSRLKSDLAAAGKRNDQLTADRAELERLLAARSGELGKSIADLRHRVSSLEGENTRLAQELAETQKARDEAQRARDEAQKAREEKVKELSSTYEQLVDKMKGEIAKGQVTISELKGKLTVNMVDAILFDSGKAEIKADGLVVLGKVIEILKSVNDKAIRIEGHTDAIPITGTLAQRYPTNWELSAARAINVARYLQKQSIDPAALSAAGFGEFKPVADNSTVEGRAKNRRIEIVLVPKD